MKFKFDIMKSEEYIRNIICGLMAVILGFLFVESFMHTMVLTNTQEMFEGISYHHDNFIFNAVYMAAALLILHLLLPKMEKAPVHLYTALLMITTLIAGTAWVISSQAGQQADQYMVSHAAWQAAHDDLSFMEDRYFSNYSFQLGMVLFYEIQLRLFAANSDTLICIQIINVIYLAAAYLALILIMGKLFGSKRIQITAAVTMMFSVQPLLYTTFVYAVIPGIANVLFSLLFEIKYFETKSKKKYIYAALSVFFMVFAVMIKTNNYIALIALAGTALVKFITRRKWTDLVYIIIMVVFSLSIVSCASSYYENRSGKKLEPSVPMIGYVAMGLDDPKGVLGCNAKGWYSSHYTTSNYASHDYDIEATKEFAMEGIKDSVHKFMTDYSYANDFFYEKNTSQWNEPSFASLWINLVVGRYGGKEAGKLCDKVLNTNGGDSHSGLLEYMNVCHLFVFAGAFAGVFVCFRKKDLLCSALILIVLGAFLYHMIFEGKSQYIMPYYIILTGFSAAGIDLILQKIPVKKS
ncbi:hypothetical protein [Ruminococcus sp. HUN007]|uniref:hypothetical protein n=1 Tax=Ruminococcus sp. HUN007 TaxID=1514668 RepID=UPI0005D28FC9|nr:hypothetical protein [Ruminococcus sp. HUN007]